MGVDLGTTFCKAVVVDLEGRERSWGRVRTPWTVVPTGAEADPLAVAAAAEAAIAAALADAPGGPVVGVGVTGLAETAVLLDRAGVPVAPSIAWHDERGDVEAAELSRDIGEERFALSSGLGVSRVATVVKLRWLQRHGCIERPVARAMSLTEWLVHRLGGAPVSEASLASRTGMFGVDDRRWSAELTEWAGLAEGCLCEIVDAGTLTGRVGGLGGGLSRLAGAAVTVGGHDHLCAAVGAAVTTPERLLDSCGTAQAYVRGVSPMSPAQILSVVPAGRDGRGARAARPPGVAGGDAVRARPRVVRRSERGAPARRPRAPSRALLRSLPGRGGGQRADRPGRRHGGMVALAARRGGKGTALAESRPSANRGGRAPAGAALFAGQAAGLFSAPGEFPAPELAPLECRPQADGVAADRAGVAVYRCSTLGGDGGRSCVVDELDAVAKRVLDVDTADAGHVGVRVPADAGTIESGHEVVEAVHAKGRMSLAGGPELPLHPEVQVYGARGGVPASTP